VTLCPPQIPHDNLGSNPGCRGGKPATNRLSYGTALVCIYIRYLASLTPKRQPCDLLIEVQYLCHLICKPDTACGNSSSRNFTTCVWNKYFCRVKTVRFYLLSARSGHELSWLAEVSLGFHSHSRRMLRYYLYHVTIAFLQILSSS
jgi:hypothetical protein